MHTFLATLLPLFALLNPTFSLPQPQPDALNSTLLPRDDGPGQKPNIPSGCLIDIFTKDHGCPDNDNMVHGSGIYNTFFIKSFFSYRLSRDLHAEEALDLFTGDGLKHPAVGVARSMGCHDTPGGMAKYHFWIPN